VANTLPLIPLLPFLGFLVNGLWGKRFPRAVVTAVGCGAPALAALFAFLAFGELPADGEPLLCSLGDWMRVGTLSVSFGLSLDRLSGIMALVVTGVGTLIHVYSTGYMKEDPGYSRYFAYLNLFLGAMLVLVLADNIVLLFLGWEGVGLCSYLLIGFWYKDLVNCNAAIKAFVVNRVGDFGFLLGIFLIFVTFGTFNFADINEAAGVAADQTAKTTALFWMALLLFFGATGKSAQIPLYVWLPDAMAGPTPVSALIHAATMVTAGVYMMARLSNLFLVSGFLPVVAYVGVFTALLAALIALTQTDIKKVLAYSTISQLGYMFFAVGVGAFGVAVFHLVTHAFFKALLFLSAGAVIHSLHHEQDMRKMGGLARKLPRTCLVFLVGALALAGFPLTAGFFSKDAILHEALGHGQYFLVTLAFATAIITAFYTSRQFVLVFLGEYRGQEHDGKREIHESPPSMLVPLYVLAFLSVVGGALAIPAFLGHELHEEGKWMGWFLGGLGSVAGISAALYLFVKSPGLRSKLIAGNPVGRTLYGLSQQTFYVDRGYEFFVLRPFRFVCLALFYLVDRLLIDWVLVGGTGFVLRAAASGLRTFQTGRVPAYAVYFVVGVLGILTLLLLTL
jgi:NADH-quinone oxidoreductase subunit L